MAITKVPNGPLIKKKGPFKGSTLKAGGKIKKAQDGTTTTPAKKSWNQMSPTERKAAQAEVKTKRGREGFSKYMDSITTSNFQRNADIRGLTVDQLRKDNKKPDDQFKMTPEKCGFGKERTGCASSAGQRERWLKEERNRKNGGPVKKAQNGESFTKDDEGYTYTKQVNRPEGKRTYQGKSIDQSTAMKIANFKSRVTPSDSLRTTTPKMKKNGGPIKKAKGGTKIKKAMMGMGSMFKDNPIYKKTTELRGKLGSAALGMPGMKPIVKNGGMLKRADGSYSKRGLWDNIRANKGSGKKPTKQMLVQEKKIKAKSKK